MLTGVLQSDFLIINFVITTVLIKTDDRSTAVKYKPFLTCLYRCKSFGITFRSLKQSVYDETILFFWSSCHNFNETCPRNRIKLVRFSLTDH